MARGAEARVAFVRAALRDDRLRLVAQPIVDLRTGRKVAEELLLRFVLPNGRLRLPAPYIRAAECYSLAVEIDLWVIDQAAMLAATGRDLHVNLSARTLSHPDIAGTVAEALERHGASASHVTFDITAPAPAAFANTGVALARDDFDSLTELADTSATMLKLDRELVARIESSDRSRAIVESIAALASRLGHTTVAKGVESERTRQLLLDCGVDLAQGFALGLPQRVS